MHTVTLIDDKTYMFNDQDEDSFYLLIEDDIAILIDTGIDRENDLLPVIRQYTNKPITLFVTHGHYDHCYHMDEFDEVYMSHDDFRMLDIDRYLVNGGNENLDIKKAKDIKNGEVIKLGNEEITAIAVGGHTPGSMVFYAKSRNMLFSGDALGSGCGVWLQLPGVLTLVEYLQGLNNLKSFLEDKNPSFYGGHYSQMTMSKHIPHYNPLNKEYVSDMHSLVERIISGEIVGTDDDPYGYGPVVDHLYAAYGRAEILYLANKI